MKKLPVILLGLFLLPATAGAAFSDMNASNPNATAVDFTERMEVVQGYPDGTFRPLAAINRAEFVKMLVAYVYDEEDYAQFKQSCFDDIPSNQWYTTYVCFARENHLIGGYPDGLFRPEQSVNFVEAAKIVGRVLGGVEETSLGENEWFQPFLAYLTQKEAIPQSIQGLDVPLKRGEMAEILYRIAVPRNLPHLAYKNGAFVRVGSDPNVSPIKDTGFGGTDVLKMSVNIRDFALEPGSIEIPRATKANLTIHSIDRDYHVFLPHLGINTVIKMNDNEVFPIETDALGTFTLACKETCAEGKTTLMGSIVVK